MRIAPAKTLVFTTWLFIALAILLPLSASAQDIVRPPPSDQEEEQPPAELAPPELLRFVEADYPEDALTSGLDGEVVLRIEIDAEGGVSGVEVVEPAGHGFDEAATEAARQFEFRPARQDDQPIASRILYRYRFLLRVEEPEEAEGGGQISIDGIVTDLDEEPIETAFLIATRASEDPEGETETDEDGSEEEVAEALVDLGVFTSFGTLS